jgi:hypothetical protein
VASLNLMEDELVARLSSRLKMSGMAAVTGTRSLHQAVASVVTDVEGAVPAALAVVVVAVAVATPVFEVAEMPAVATVKATTAL